LRRGVKASGATAKRSGCSQGAKKEFLRIGCEEPYRKPTQAGEKRILRRTRELALRNSAKYTRNFGISVAPFGCHNLRGVAVKWSKRLFIKNTGLCESVKRRIGTDTCPVPEG